MIDGEVRNTVTAIHMRCYLCTQFNSLEKVSSLPVDEENLSYGIAWIHFMEYFLRLGYKLQNQKWQALSKEDQDIKDVRKKLFSSISNCYLGSLLIRQK